MGGLSWALKSILLEYNLLEAQVKFTMLSYFWKDLKLSILAKLQKENLELESFVQIMKKWSLLRPRQTYGFEQTL